MKILVVEDDKGLAETLQQMLSSQHYLVECAADGQAAWELVQAFEYDLILLDWMLPKLDGVRFCRQLRALADPSSFVPSSQGSELRLNQNTPIILLTAQDSSTNRVIGLDAGADDYVIKPFDIQELLARIRALLRRGVGTRSPIIRWHNLQLNPISCEVAYNNQLLRLTSKEYELLELFLRHPRRIFSQSAIIERLWLSDDPPTENAVRTHIKGLRHKLKKAGVGEIFETVYGLGYRLKEAKGEGVREAREAEESGEIGGSRQGVEDNYPPSTIHHPPSTIHSPTPYTPHPTPPSPSTDTIRPELTAIWTKYQRQYVDRLAVIEQAIAAIAQGTISQQLWTQAQREAHTLVGSLGSFGLRQATRMTRELEQLLKESEPLSSEQCQQLVSLSASLKDAILQFNGGSNPVYTAASTPVPSEPAVRLLIVHDNAAFGTALTTEAAQWSIQSAIAPTFAQAREQLESTLPDIILLSLGITNSEECGMDFLAELSGHHPDIPVVAVAAEASLAERLQAIQWEARAFLDPSLSPKDMLRTIAQTVQQSAPPTGTLLIVDDDPGLLETLRSLLNPWGFNLVLLSQPQSFWQTLQQTNPDLLILDIEMPEISGIDLCRVVRNDPQWDELPVLILSVHTDAETIARVFTVGADDYISKPIVGPELIARILNRLERARMIRQLHTLRLAREDRKGEG